ncbi:MAG TPA: lantibiotic dehydratase [Solirubrobacter sp.]|nr:lantibiotic dehydratase [Solirubrobacter sp.]
MTAADALGCSGLLRVAGLPVRFWLAGAAPELMVAVARLERAASARDAAAVSLAERIGSRLVPDPRLTREDRAFVLALRRRLHRGASIADVPPERLRSLAAADAASIEALAALIARDRELATSSSELDVDLERELDRLLWLPDRIAEASAVARAVLGPESGPAARLSRKSRRHRAEHQWRRIARAATATTPRGWLSHVALVELDSAAGAPAVTARFAAHWVENVRAGGVGLTRPADDWPAAGTRLAVNPLRWEADGALTCVALDASRDHGLVTVRRTALLDAVCDVLADGSRSFADVASALGCGAGEERLALRGFVRHLVALGVLQPSAPPRVGLTRRADPAGTFAAADDGWVDVYRHAAAGIPTDLARTIQAGALDVLRIVALAADRVQVAAPAPGDAWSLTDLLRADSGAGWSVAERSRGEGGADAGFATLAHALAAQADAGDIVIDAALLDACGAPPAAALTWPVDCLVRVPAPGAGFTAVLEQLWPPGMLDARFAAALAELHGPVPHVEAYRAFLRELERLTGYLLVELLLPPLQDGAANAVRRPLYTSAWTGDPHTAAYLQPDQTPARYLPPRAIRIRRAADGRLQADADGQPLWPVYHATRSFSPPWDRLARVLLAAAPIELPWDAQRALRRLIELPDRSTVPRIRLSGGLVLAPARWRLPPDALWDRDAPPRAKLRALVRLRERHALPRWIQVERGDRQPPLPGDLDSVHVLRTLERCPAPLTVSELLPAPDQFPVADGAHRPGDRLAAQLQIRLPYDTPATALAARAAAAARGPPPRAGVPSTPAITRETGSP